MSYKELMYQWIKEVGAAQQVFSVEEMLILSDFSDWLDEQEALYRKAEEE